MKQVETDVVVISAGTAGLPAAVTAAENGAKVAVFEKSSTSGGLGNMARGPLAVESRLQRQRQIPLTREDAFRIFMDYTHWRVDARLVKAYLDRSAGTIDWLEKLGVEFSEVVAYFPGSNFTQHIVAIQPGAGGPAPGSGGPPPGARGPAPGSGGPPPGARGAGPMGAASMMKILTDRAKELGCIFYFQTAVKKILKNEGRITSVIAEDASSEEIQANAKAVIVATGGFGNNPDMIKKYTGYEWGKDIFSFRIPGCDGDGIRMAWDVGAGAGPMNMEIIYNPPGVSSPEFRSGAIAFRQPNLLVNLLGERFMNEEIIANTTFTGNAIACQKERVAYMIFDESIKKHYEEVGWDSLVLAQGLKAQNLDAEFAQALKNGLDGVMIGNAKECFFMANSFEELSDKTKISLDGLRNTLAEYNRACETGRDTLFNKIAKYLRPVRQPPFYIGRLAVGGYGSLGGIKINYKTEVLTKDFDVIPGLYAAGVDANAIYGDSYVFILPGNTMGFAMNSGRMAGENAANYVKKSK